MRGMINAKHRFLMELAKSDTLCLPWSVAASRSGYTSKPLVDKLANSGLIVLRGTTACLTPKGVEFLLAEINKVFMDILRVKHKLERLYLLGPAMELPKL